MLKPPKGIGLFENEPPAEQREREFQFETK